MEHNTIKEMRQILDAIEQGKPIQWYNATKDKWDDTTNKRPNFTNSTYRIKPEEPKKKRRPFKDTDELIAYNDGLRILWLTDKTDGEKRLVTTYGSDYVKFLTCRYSMSELFESYTFADGTPCGVEEDA